MLAAAARTTGKYAPKWPARTMTNTSIHVRLFSAAVIDTTSIDPITNIRSTIDSHATHSTVFNTNGQFKTHFDSPVTYANFQEVREGGYIEDKEVDILLPEGLAGDMSTEFQTSGRTSWMVRDGSKLLCRLIDEYSSVPKGKGGKKLPQNLVQPLNISGLTDRKEWSAAELSVQSFGKELFEPAVGTHNGFDIAQGEGSRVEKCVKRVKALTAGTTTTKIMLLGPRGVGKSAMLNQAVVHARRQGWLCMFVPEGWNQVQSGAFIEPLEAATSSATSSSLGQLFDNSWQTADVLRGFWRAHAEMLRGIPIVNIKKMEKYDNFLKDFNEQWQRALSVPGRDKFRFIQMREMVYGEDTFPEVDALDEDVLSKFDFLKFQFKTLEDVVLLGVALRDLAGPLFLDLVEELRNLESHKVLFAVDQYNSWEGPSAFQYNKQVVYGKQLAVPHALGFISKKKAETMDWTLKNGMCIASCSMKHPEGRAFDFESWKASIPLALTIPCYSRLEFLSAVSYYAEQKVIPDVVNLNTLLSYRMHTGSNGRLVREQAIPYFFPRAVEAHSKSLNLNILTSDVTASGGSIFGDADNVGDFSGVGGDDEEEDWGGDDKEADAELTEQVVTKRKPVVVAKKGGKK